jgi:putative transcriptional regulator
MKDEDFAVLVQSIRQAGAIRKGRGRPGRVYRYATPNVKGIRRKLHVSQSEFAHMIGVSVDTVQNWEQKRREPEGPAKALLTVAQKNPAAVVRALHAA